MAESSSSHPGLGAAPATHARSTWMFGRGLGLVFLIAFASLHVQLEGLIGDHGIVPASELLEAMRAQRLGFADYPSLAWLLGADGASLHLIAILGELASLALLIGLMPGLAALLATFAYLSLHSVGGPFLSFQWDTLLIETGSLAALVLPCQPFHSPKRLREPFAPARWALYLLLFRLIFLSGVVKLASGDETWRSLEALDYHYWTQPLPNPLSWFAHQLPGPVQAAATATTLAAELLLPLAIFFGRRGRRVAALGIVTLMILIQLTGNYGFFNLLTIAIALPLVDDAAWGARVRRWLSPAPDALPDWRVRARLALTPILAALVLLGALQIGYGLGAGPRYPDFVITAMDRVSPYRLVNGYGLFAVMTTERREIVIEGSLDGDHWEAYTFAYKPGDPSELPGQSAPHMPRLDWQMWFAALGPFRHSPWLVRFMLRLLEARPEVLGLLEDDPFDGRPPRFVRARVRDYRFGDWDRLVERGEWWVVGEPRPYGPVISEEALRRLR